MIIVQHEGKKGLRGVNGVDGLGVDLISYAKSKTPYLETFGINTISQGVTWERDGEASFTDRYNREVTIQPKTSNMVLNYTTVNESNWFDPFGLNLWEVSQTGILDPFGGNLGVRLTINNTLSETHTLVAQVTGFVNVGQTYRVSFYAKLVSGSVSSIGAGISNFARDGGVLFDVNDLGSNWFRFSGIVTATNPDQLIIYFGTAGAVLDIYTVNITEGIGTYDPIVNLVNAPIPIITNSQIYRANDNGYLIEEGSENLCTSSENLLDWAIVGGGVVSNNIEFDSFDSGGSNTRISINNPVILSLDNQSLIEGVEYTVSLVAIVEEGQIDSISVSLGGGNSNLIVPRDNYQRTLVKCTAGPAGNITIQATNFSANTVIILAGIQVERGEATSYIPTRNGSRSRPFDKVTEEVSRLPSLARPFSIKIDWNGVIRTLARKYLYNISDSVCAYLIDNRLSIHGGGNQLLEIELDNIVSNQVFIIFNGSSLSVVRNGVEIDSAAYSGESVRPAFFRLGAQGENGELSLNGFISELTFFNCDLSVEDTKYLGGA